MSGRYKKNVLRSNNNMRMNHLVDFIKRDLTEHDKSNHGVKEQHSDAFIDGSIELDVLVVEVDLGPCSIWYKLHIDLSRCRVERSS